jgi:hypothetical protein
MSSASPPKEPEVEHENQSGDDPESMDRDNQDPSGQGQGEFEVKEQDRWLPIANGASSAFLHFVLLLCSCVTKQPISIRAGSCFPMRRVALACCLACCLAALWPDCWPNQCFLLLSSRALLTNTYSRSHHEDRAARKRQNRKGGQRMHARVCERVYLVHHQRG